MNELTELAQNLSKTVDSVTFEGTFHHIMCIIPINIEGEKMKHTRTVYTGRNQYSHKDQSEMILEILEDFTKSNTSCFAEKLCITSYPYEKGIVRHLETFYGEIVFTVVLINKTSTTTNT